MPTLSIPLFPLNAVLFPGGPLSLRIFEPRYLDMVSHCLKTDSAFGVCLIQDGKEAGPAAVPHSIGTLARIIDWDKLPEGLLGIVVLGSHRFVIESTEIGNNQLVSGTVKVLPETYPRRLASRTGYTAPPAGANYYRSRPPVRFHRPQLRRYELDWLPPGRNIAPGTTDQAAAPRNR